jgi:hypothetical protein
VCFVDFVVFGFGVFDIVYGILVVWWWFVRFWEYWCLDCFCFGFLVGFVRMGGMFFV